MLLTVGEQVFRMDAAGVGRYEVEVPGIREDAIVARAEAAAGGVFLGDRIAAFRLPCPPTEMDDVGLNEEFLQECAERVGGRYLDIDDVDESLVDAFPAQTRGKIVSEAESTWPCWPLLIALCACLSTEWFIRRAVGMS